MKYLSFKDKKLRKSYENNEIEILRSKAIAFNINFPLSIKYFYFNKISNHNKNSTIVRIKNRCLFTNRGQSTYRVFRLNRSTLREMMGLGFIQGARKSSW
jgi:ribosomal protein S14